MKIKLVIELDDRVRRAINLHVGRKGPATRAECKAHLELAINGNIEDVCYDFDKAQGESA